MKLYTADQVRAAVRRAYDDGATMNAYTPTDGDLDERADAHMPDEDAAMVPADHRRALAAKLLGSVVEGGPGELSPARLATLRNITITPEAIAEYVDEDIEPIVDEVWCALPELLRGYRPRLLDAPMIAAVTVQRVLTLIRGLTSDRRSAGWNHALLAAEGGVEGMAVVDIAAEARAMVEAVGGETAEQIQQALAFWGYMKTDEARTAFDKETT